MTTTGAMSLSDHDNRTVEIEVVGICNNLARKSNRTITVPYRRLSQEMQRLMRLGSTIVSVKLVSFSLTGTESAQIPALPKEKVPLEVESPTISQGQNPDIVKAKPLQRSRNRLAAKKTTRTTKTRRRRTIKGQTRVQ
ncbi:MAG: hypothetical protein F6K36_08750 [Symploca sp. SIO3C6]|nr:hypothetical protein [Symploca sp. SIO3C6]